MPPTTEPHGVRAPTSRAAFYDFESIICSKIRIGHFHAIVMRQGDVTQCQLSCKSQAPDTNRLAKLIRTWFFFAKSFRWLMTSSKICSASVYSPPSLTVTMCTAFRPAPNALLARSQTQLKLASQFGTSSSVHFLNSPWMTERPSAYSRISGVSGTLGPIASSCPLQLDLGR
jgi:hypothetical protein